MEDIDCPICQDPITEETENIILPCNHQFHTECIGRSLNYNYQQDASLRCSICNQELSIEFLIENNFVIIEGHMIKMNSRFMEESDQRDPIEEILNDPFVQNFIGELENIVQRIQPSVVEISRRECTCTNCTRPWYYRIIDSTDRFFKSKLHHSAFFICAWLTMGSIAYSKLFS